MHPAGPRLSEEELALFNDTLDACTATPRFLDEFYDRFVAASPEVAAKFAGTDMTRQKRALKASLYISMLAADANRPALEHLTRLHGTHVEMRIDDALYAHWERCLLAAAASCAPDWTDDVAVAWEKVLAVAIYVMKSGDTAPFLGDPAPSTLRRGIHGAMRSLGQRD